MRGGGRLDRVLPLVGGSLPILSRIARAVSLRTTRTIGASWTGTVLRSTEHALQGKRAQLIADAERELQAAADANNRAWGGSNGA